MRRRLGVQLGWLVHGYEFSDHSGKIFFELTDDCRHRFENCPNREEGLHIMRPTADRGECPGKSEAFMIRFRAAWHRAGPTQRRPAKSTAQNRVSSLNPARLNVIVGGGMPQVFGKVAELGEFVNEGQIDFSDRAITLL